MAYRLELPEGSKIHPVFHVSCLKKAVGRDQAEINLPSEVGMDLFLGFEPQEVLAERIHLLLRWKGRTDEDATWENLEDFKEQFPEFLLEHKAIFEEAGRVITLEPLDPITLELSGPREGEVDRPQPRLLTCMLGGGKGKTRHEEIQKKSEGWLEGII